MAAAAAAVWLAVSPPVCGKGGRGGGGGRGGRGGGWEGGKSDEKWPAHSHGVDDMIRYEVFVSHEGVVRVEMEKG